ncbi:MAG TPA: PepSY-associated TM helix domain-containing protein [Sphingomonas sp.]|uniref:PepSY-associated TM helix domain-containing protein n=1 Tax=Sphingomonas sp. TaxID=28214 RepID=UPI002ED9059F
MTRPDSPRQSIVQRALGGHAAIGLLASALIYILALTGSLIVIHDRWQRWEQPLVTETRYLSPDAAQRAMQAVLASEAGKPRTAHLYIRMPTDDLPRAVVTTDNGAWYVDGAGRVVGREAHAWTEFLIAMHEYLHLPTTWGLILVGALGVMLVVLVVTGVLAHPRIIRDAFRLRMRHDPQIARADWHNRLGVWTVPFVLAVALTGAFIGLGSVGFSMLARAYTGGDMERIYAPIFGQDPAPDAAKAPLADAATALRVLGRRVPFADPTYVTIHDPGTRGQHIQILADHPRRLIYGESYVFDGAGRWRGPIGLSNGAIGKQVAASTYNLHFGNYGGLAVEIAYMLLGGALCVVTATGTTLWLQKRRRRGLRGDRLAACWDVILWGVPLLLLAMLWLRALAGPDAPLAAGFWSSLAAAIIVAAARPAVIARAHLRRTVAAAVLTTACLHLIAFPDAPPGVIAIDAVIIVPFATTLAIRFGRRRRPAAPGTVRTLEEVGGAAR